MSPVNINSFLEISLSEPISRCESPPCFRTRAAATRVLVMCIRRIRRTASSFLLKSRIAADPDIHLELLAPESRPAAALTWRPPSSFQSAVRRGSEGIRVRCALAAPTGFPFRGTSCVFWRGRVGMRLFPYMSPSSGPKLYFDRQLGRIPGLMPRQICNYPVALPNAPIWAAQTATRNPI